MRFPDARILVFAREPRAGHAKTRLIPLLGAAGAAALHARFVYDTLATTCDAGLAPVELWCSPGADRDFFRACRDRFPLTLHGQVAGDLGMRMLAACREALARAGRVVLVGTDCPGLQAADLAGALEALGQGSDLVLGPARDGGYYLIGLRVADAELFDAMEWGSATVFAETLRRARARALACHCLPERADVDTPEDYRRLLGASGEHPH